MMWLVISVPSTQREISHSDRGVFIMPSFVEISTQLLNGVVIGLIYALIALGFMLILGVMEVINFTHGLLFAFGAYLAFTLGPFVGFWLSLLISGLMVGLMAMIIEIPVRRTYGKDPLLGLLLTFGAAMALEETIRIIWGPGNYSVVVPSYASGPIGLGFMVYSKYRFFLAGLAILLIILTWLFLEKTPYGAYIKAGAFDSEMVMALGVDLKKLRTLVFGLGGALAAVAGVIAAPLWSIKPTMGGDAIMPAFVVVVIGGIGSFWGAVLAGLMVGVVTSISVMFMPRTSSIVMYILMAIIVLIRPRGLMGEKSILEG
jgi:branched-subunit amino acid ABC-type transport system permease component